MENESTPQTPHQDDRKTLSQLADLGVIAGGWVQLLDDAYHLGRIRGRLEGAEAFSATLTEAINVR